MQVTSPLVWSRVPWQPVLPLMPTCPLLDSTGPTHSSQQLTVYRWGWVHWTGQAWISWPQASCKRSWESDIQASVFLFVYAEGTLQNHRCGQEIWTDPSQKQMQEQPTSTWDDGQHRYLLGNCKWKPQGDDTLHPLKGLKFKTDNTKCWQGSTATGPLLCCQPPCKMLQPLWKKQFGGFLWSIHLYNSWFHS